MRKRGEKSSARSSLPQFSSLSIVGQVYVHPRMEVERQKVGRIYIGIDLYRCEYG